LIVTWESVDSTNLSQIPNKSGVYLIAYLRSDNKYEVVYAGKADDLQNRTQQHFSDSETNEELKKFLQTQKTFRIWFAEVGKEDDRNGIESYLIAYYNPRFNTQQPTAAQIKVNL
jgi:excinuclease UvrABC nuclease subunit